MTAGRSWAVVAVALACSAVAVALILASDHIEDREVWVVFGPAVGLSFIGTGLYAWRRRPESRTGALMVLLGFAWCVAVLGTANASLPHTLGSVVGGLWGGVFLHLLLAFPSGRLEAPRDRRLVVAGYLVFTVATVPALLVAAPADLGCPECPENAFLIAREPALADVALAVQTLLYVVLLVLVVARLVRRWRRAAPRERLTLTPVYASGLGTFALATVAQAGGGATLLWPALIAAALLPLAFLGGLLRGHVARLDADLRASLEELRASRVRIVEAGDVERRRLERNLHDGAQARLVGVALLLGHARLRADTNPGEVPDLLDRALGELSASLSELRELAHGIHPAVLSQRGLDAALATLAARAPVPVRVAGSAGGRLPEPVEIAVYFAASEGLANVAKYARATEAGVTVGRRNGRVVLEVADDGVGGADAARGSGLRGLADRVAALDGTLTVDSPAGRGTRLHVEIPC